MVFQWLLVHLLPTIGFILALALLSHILKERRSPASTMAWLMAVIFIPYLGVPFYLIFGGRKMISKTGSKPDLMCNRRLTAARDIPAANTHLLETDSGVFPASANNHITLLPKGEQAYQTILDLIHNARSSIDIATFILGEDETGKAIVHALAGKAAQGLEIRLLIDALGSVRISRAFLAPLLEAGGRVAYFMPMLHLPFRGRANLRNHRKMLICDNKTAVIGGMNLASEYLGPRDLPGRWRDLSLVVQGPVIGHISGIFDSDWAFASKTPRDNHQASGCSDGRGRGGALVPGGVTQLVVSGPDVPNDSLRNAILTEIFRAKRRIWIVTPYFVPDELMFESLCIAVSRNVDVSIIVPKKSNHRLADIVREGYLSRIQEAGGALWLYEPRMLHAKAILVDDSLAMVGSANMDMRSMLLNYEIALCMYAPPAIEQLESWMLDLMSGCSRRPADAKHPSGLVESVARLFAPLL
ncbi:MAG: cardiolipin synthase [Desulfosarcinaceae bacterium]